MSELIIRDDFVTIRPGANERVDGSPVVRMQLTATRLIVSPWNDAADELLDGSLIFEPEQLRAFLATRPEDT